MALNSETKQAAHNRLSFIGVIVTLGIVFEDIVGTPQRPFANKNNIEIQQY